MARDVFEIKSTKVLFIGIRNPVVFLVFVLFCFVCLFVVVVCVFFFFFFGGGGGRGGV